MQTVEKEMTKIDGKRTKRIEDAALVVFISESPATTSRGDLYVVGLIEERLESHDTDKLTHRVYLRD